MNSSTELKNTTNGIFSPWRGGKERRSAVGGKEKLKWYKDRWRLEGKLAPFWQYFDEEQSDNKAVCQLCKQKLT